MRRVITYGTYDLLHQGHLRLLQRARELGDYLVVGVTSEDFDRQRGKVNVRQSLVERMDAVRATGIADEVIVEEYPGQKIDDVRRYEIDVFTAGSDWKGEFDYLKEWCEVIYLDRTKGVSSTQIRTEEQRLRLGIIGSGAYVEKVIAQAKYVNGIEAIPQMPVSAVAGAACENANLDRFLSGVDAVYIRTHPEEHYSLASRALELGVSVLCESPSALGERDYDELVALAKTTDTVFVDAVKTAYATAFERMLLLVKSGEIGKIVSIDSTCTSMRPESFGVAAARPWGSAFAWGPTALLPIFRLLGTDYETIRIWSMFSDEHVDFDLFGKIDLEYSDAVASAKFAKGAKSEGELIVSGTEGYVYIPSPWWKTDYFEVRYEDSSNNRRYFYPLDGEGIRYELVSFMRTVEKGGECPYSPHRVARTIVDVMSLVYASREARCNEFVRKVKLSQNTKN